MLTNTGTGPHQRVVQSFRLANSNNAQASINEAQRVRAALIESVARDVGRPLALILSAATTLRRRSGVTRESVQGELIEIIENEADRLEGFVSILVDMTKLEAEAVKVCAEALELKDIVKVAVEDAARALHDRKTEMNFPADLPKLRLDPVILRRVLGILVENAAAQTPSGSTVSIQAGRDTAGVRLQIMDQGNGIPPGDIGRIFAQFHLPCIDEHSQRGAGMQLAVCRGYIEAMGGTIAAGNRTDGSGAVFTITFPAGPALSDFGRM